MLDPGKPIRRSRTERMVAGICGGLAEWAGWDPSVVRALCIVASVTVALIPGIVAYALLWVALPEAATVSVVAAEAARSESS